MFNRENYVYGHRTTAGKEEQKQERGKGKAGDLHMR